MSKNNKKKYMLIVTGDENDADYVTKTTYIDADKIPAIKKVLERIANFKPYTGKYISSWNDVEEDWTHHNNFPTGEYVRIDLGEKTAHQLYAEGIEEDFEYFCELVPCNIHTLKKVELIKVSNIEKLF